MVELDCVEAMTGNEDKELFTDKGETFYGFANSLPQLAWIADPDGYIYWFNQRWYDYTGTTLEEMQGSGWIKVHHPDHIDRVLNKYKEYWAAGTIWEDTFPLRSKNGEYRWFLSRAMPHTNSEGKILRWYGSNTDITEQLKTQEQLVQAKEAAEAAEKAKSEFLANMSHEIRSPMNSVIGYADLLTAASIDKSTRLEYAQRIVSNGSHLLNILNDILDLTKMDHGKLHIETTQFSLKSLMSDVCHSMKVLAAQKSINLEFDYPAGTPKVFISDPLRLRQIVVNLVGNAIKFTATGFVRMEVEYLGNQKELQISVVDTGLGLSHESRQMLFEPFTQVDSAVNRNFSGSGLGLHLSQRLAQHLGGEITIPWSELGKGSRFTLTLRDMEPGKSLKIPLKPLQISDSSDQPYELPDDLKILVAEDSLENQRLIRIYLETVSEKLEFASNGKEALEKVQSQEFDVVLMDIMMPTMDGIEATKTLRELGFTMPIIAFTAHVMKEEVDEIFKAGCDGYIPKPIAKAHLLEAMSQTIRRLSSEK